MSVPTGAQNDPMVMILKAVQQQHEANKDARLAAVKFAREAGLSYAEIADELNVTPDAIRKMLARAVK